MRGRTNPDGNLEALARVRALGTTESEDQKCRNQQSLRFESAITLRSIRLCCDEMPRGPTEVVPTNVLRQNSLAGAFVELINLVDEGDATHARHVVARSRRHAGDDVGDLGTK